MTEIVSPSTFATARASLLKEEKAATQLLQSLAAKRRALPRVKVNDPSQFKFINSAGSTVTLPDLFENRKQLMMYQFMLPADANNPLGCPGCSFFSDNVPHGPGLNHLHSRSTTFCCVAPAGIESVNAWKSRMGWTFPFYSAIGLEQKLDEQGEKVSWKPKEDGIFGLQVFIKESDGNVYHTYETSSRGVESVLATLALLDMTPLGRQDGSDDVEGLRLHDEYKFAK